MRTVKILGLLVAILGLLTAIIALLTEGLKLYKELPTQTPQIVTIIATLPETISQPTLEIVSIPTAVVNVADTPSPQIAPIGINDLTNNKSLSFDFPPIANAPKSCMGVYIETGMAIIDYKLDVPKSWGVVIDSWKAEWSSGNYQNDGILVITGEWQGNVKINIGAICAVPINLLQSTIEIRRSQTNNDGRPEYAIP